MKYPIFRLRTSVTPPVRAGPPPLPPLPFLTMFSLLHKTAPRRGAVLACVNKTPAKSAGRGLPAARFTTIMRTIN